MENNILNTHDKVVFVIDHKVNNNVLPISDKAFNYVSKTLDSIMLTNDASADNVFIGGSPISLSVWISNIICLYQMKQLEIQDCTIIYKDDPDFDLDK